MKISIEKNGTLLFQEDFESFLKEELAKQKEEILASIREMLGSTVPEEPKPELPKCDRGPDIKKITQSGSRSLDVLFDGMNVNVIEAFVYKPNSTNIIDYVTNPDTGQHIGDTGVFKPNTNTPRLALKEDLQKGIQYRVKFKAIECSGESESFFFTEPIILPPLPVPCPKPLGKINSIKIIK